MLEWAAFFVLGLIASTFGIMVGTGGGIILVPILLVFSNLEPELIAGTALALVAINSIGSSVSYLRMGYVDRRSGLMFAVAAIPGAVVAPFIVENVPDNLFRLLFAFLLLSLAFQLIVKPTFKGQLKERQIDALVLMLKNHDKLVDEQGNLIENPDLSGADISTGAAQ